MSVRIALLYGVLDARDLGVCADRRLGVLFYGHAWRFLPRSLYATYRCSRCGCWAR